MLRITSRTFIDRALDNINAAQRRMAELQQRLASGKRISKPSDDPAGITRALSIRRGIQLNTQYTRNINSGVARLSATEAALASLTEIVQRARELAITGGNDTFDQSQRNQVAAEVSGLLGEAISIGNTQFAGQYIFAGHQSTTVAFTAVGTPPTSVTYNGDAGVIEREIGVRARVQINVAGDTAFAATFATLITLRDDLTSGNMTAVRGADLAALDDALDGILQQRGVLGATTNRLELTGNRLEITAVAQKQLLSQTEDADIIATIVDLNAQESVFQAALATVARSVQSTLLNFLR